MFVQPGSSSTCNNLELPVGSFQRELWGQVHYDEQGYNRGYPVAVTMFLGGGEEIKELTGRDKRDNDPESFATNAFRAAVLSTPIKALGELQTDTEGLYWQAQEGGDVLFHAGIGLYALGVKFEEVVDARARAMAPTDNTPVETFGDFDELVYKHRDNYRLVVPGFTACVDMAADSLSVVNEAGAQYLRAYEQLLKDPPADDAPPDFTYPIMHDPARRLKAHNPAYREEMIFTAGSLLWCLSWVAQFRLQTSLEEMAHQSVKKAVRRREAGLAVLFGRGDKR